MSKGKEGCSLMVVNSVKVSSPKHTPDDSIQTRWQNCSQQIQEKISPQGYQTWVRPIIPVTFVDEKLILRVPSQFFFEWLESNYQEIIHAAVKKEFGIRTKVEYLVASSPDNQPEELNLNSENSSGDRANKTFATDNLTTESDEEFILDIRYQFDNFISINDNELAYRAALAVAKHPGKTDYNPLFIYGESGCGKTHLLNAIGNHLTEHRKRKHLWYLTSENFLNEYIYALQNRKLQETQKKFSQTDVLLLDDMQFLTNKKKSQEGLLFFFSEMERRHKQIVVTSTIPPAQLTGFDPRLSSFFHKGLIVDLIAPSYETRVQWIDGYAEKNGFSLLPEVREFIAINLNGGLHQLRAVMVRIAAQSSLLGKPVSLNNTQRMLTHIDPNWARKNGGLGSFQPVKIDKIIEKVSNYMKIPPDVIIGYSRQREVSTARQICIFFCKELTQESLQTIGYHFSDRHYTTILHNYNKIKDELKKNPILSNILLEIKNQLTQ